jgi:cytochrome d ubiquinol oxidase subunit II
LVGVALGNLTRGVPLDANKVYAGSFWTLLNPYALLVGLTTLALFAMHGTIYLVMKTEGELQSRIRGWVKKAIAIFVVFYALMTVATFVFVPRMLDNLRAEPVLFLIPGIALLAIANIPREIHHGREFRAFLSSCFAMAGLLVTFGLGVFPNLIFSEPLAANSLTIYNAASSARTHEIMLIIALLGMPLVIAYTVSIYWIFRGKVELDPTSY